MRSTWGALIGLASIVIAPILPAVAQDAASPMAVTSQAVPASPAAVNYNGTDTYTGTIGIGQGGYLYFRKDINNGVGYRQGFSTIGGFQPLMLTPNGGLFGQGQMFITDDGQVGGNLGGGARYFAEEANRVFGAYGFFDFDDTQSGFSNQQIGIGFETLGPMWDFRANGYFPLNTDQHFVRLNSVSSTPFFSGNTALFTGQALFQKTMVGGDAEIGIPLFDPSAFGRLRVYFGGYGYDGAKKDQIGARARIEDHINEYVTIGAAFMHDDVNGDMVTMAVDIRGWSRVLPNLNNRDISNRAKMFLPVVRQYRIATERFQSSITAAALGPNGTPLNVVWVDNSNAAAGDGTFENPFHNLPSSAAGADYILVRNGASSQANPVLGGITLANNQIMYGEGFNFNVVITGNGFGTGGAGNYAITSLVPGWNTTGVHPFLSNPSGNTITLANNNQVAGFNIVDSSASAINGNGINNFTLSHLTLGSTNASFGNGGWGIDLVNASGVGTITDVAMLNNTLGGLTVQNTSTAPLTLTVAGTTGTTPNVTGGSNGIFFKADNSQINATVSDIRDSGSNVGLIARSSNSGDISLAVTNASFNNATANGIDLQADGAGLSFNFTDVKADDAAVLGLVVYMLNGADVTGTVSGTTLGGSSFSNSGDQGVYLRADNDAVATNSITFFQTAMNDNTNVGLYIDSLNGSQFTANFNTGTINNNGIDNIFTNVDGGSTLTLNVDPSDLSGAVTGSGFEFDVNNGSSLFANLDAVTITGSGFQGINGFVNNGSTATLTVNNSNITQSQEYGVLIQAQNGSTATTNITGTVIGSNNQSLVGFGGIGIFADNSTTNLNMFQTDVTNSSGTQFLGLWSRTLNGGTFNGDIDTTNFFDNIGDGARVEVHGAGSLANVDFISTGAIGNSGNGVNLIADTGATLQASVSGTSAFSANTGNGLLLTATGGTTIAQVTGSGASTFDNSLNGAGVRIDATAVAQIVANIAGGASNNATNGMEFNITNQTASGADLSVNGSFNDMSRNGNNGVLFNITGSNVARASASNLFAEGNGQNGILYSITNSTLNNVSGSPISVSNTFLQSNGQSGLSFALTDVNGADSTDISISGNTLDLNTRDGLRIVNTSAAVPANRVDISATFNEMNTNVSRGMNVLNRGNANMSLNASSNTIDSNEHEGVYIMNTASTTQSAEFGFGPAANGAVNAKPIMNLVFNNNTVTNNGATATTVAAGGFVLRVGTSDASTSFTDDGGTATGGRGGVVASMDSNTFTTNTTADVYFDSFRSTVNPVTTAGTWTDNNTNGVPGDDVFSVGTYRADPIARLDLTFSNNTGDNLAGTNGGASYNNPEAQFKSRTNALGGEGADGQGPFISATRDRNAQRLAFRGALPPTMTAGNAFLFSGMGTSSFRVQNINNVFTGGNGFVLDVAPYVNPLTDAQGVDAASAAVTSPLADFDTMPWGWSVLP